MDPLKTASVASESPDSGIDLPKDIYHKESVALKNDLLRKEKDWKNRSQKVLAREAELKKESQANSTYLSEMNRIKNQLIEIQKEKAQLNSELNDMHIGYLKKLISLLQRQRGDARFSSFSDKIDRQIDDLRKQKKSLEQKL